MNRRMLGMVLDVLQRRPAEAHRIDAPIHVVCGPRTDAARQVSERLAEGWRVMQEIPLDVYAGVAYTHGELIRHFAVDAHRAGRAMLDDLKRIGGTMRMVPPAPASEPWALFLLTREEPS